MKLLLFSTLISIVAIFLLLSCLNNKYSAEEQKLVNEIMRQRREKDSSFLHEDWSPLLSEDKESFAGLKYFPIDLSLRFEGPIIKYESNILDTIIGTKGDLRPSLKYGYFPFKYKNESFRLQIYNILRDDPQLHRYLFLGFTDLTTGQETYGAGRYIDLTENDKNNYFIDFNLAYNPYCAYNSRYSCALPPAENSLPFPARAGEKIFKVHK